MGFFDFLRSPGAGLGINRGDLLPFQVRGAERVTPPGRSNTVTTVSSAQAFGLVAFYRGATIISNAMKQLTLETYRGIEKVEAPLWLRRPSNDPFSVFVEQTTISLISTGNAFWRKYRNARSEVIKLEVLNPADVAVQSDDSGALTGYLYRGSTLFAIDEIQHLALLRLPGNLLGLGPIQAAQSELYMAKSTIDYSKAFFDSSGVPVGGYLSSDMRVSDEEADRASDAWSKAASGRVPVMGMGLKFQQMFLTPRDAQWLESIAHSDTTVARLLGIPVDLMAAAVDGTSLTYQNLRDTYTNWLRLGLSQYIVEMETAFGECLPRGLRAEFDVESLLRPDARERYEMYEIAARTGWLTIPEIREREGLPATGGNNGIPGI